MKWAAGIFLLAVYGGAALAGKNPASAVPTPEKVAHYGCAIVQRTSTKNLAGGWYLTVWVNYNDRPEPAGTQHHWEALYSVRQKRSEAFKDCDQWMEETGKAIKSSPQKHNGQ